MARNFAGGTDRILFGAANGLTSGCVAFWFRTSGVTTNTHILSCWNASSRTGLGFILNNTANKLKASGIDATTERVAAVSTTSVNNGAWHHAAFNFNVASGAANSLYIDGALEASVNSSAAWSLGSTSIVFGDPLDTFWPTFNGDLAEAGFWIDRNLSADEIAALAKGYSPKCVHLEGLGGYWPFLRDQYNRADSFISSTVGTTVTDHPRIIAGLV